MTGKSISRFTLQGKSRPSLRVDFGWTLLGNAVYAGGQFATLMILAKLLRPEDVGQYALGLAIVYPVMMFANLQLRSVMTAEARPRTQFGHFLGLRLLTTAISLVLVLCIARALQYSWELTGVILAVGGAYGVETISDMYYARLQLHDRMKEISKSMMARAALSVAVLVAVAYATRSVLWGIGSIFLARAIVLFAYDARRQTHGLESTAASESVKGRLAPRFDGKLQRDLLWFSFPLGIVVFLTMLNSSLPSYFIKQQLGEHDLGIFTAIGFVISVGNMAVVSLGQAAFTRLARTYGNGEYAKFWSLLGKLLMFGALLGVCGMVLSALAGHKLILILFRPEYAERADLLPWIMGAGGMFFMAQFLGFGMTAAGHYNAQVIVNCAAIAALFAACYWLVAARGLLGAVLAMLIAAAVQLAGSVAVLSLGIGAPARSCAGRIEAA